MPSLIIEGDVRRPRTLAGADLAALPEQVEDVGVHLPGRRGQGVWLRALLDEVGVLVPGGFATLASADGSFALSVSLAPLVDRAIVAYRLDDEPLPASLGGPFRLLIVGSSGCGDAIDSCANVKRLGRIRLTAEREPDVGHAPHPPPVA